MAFLSLILQEYNLSNPKYDTEIWGKIHYGRIVDHYAAKVIHFWCVTKTRKHGFAAFVEGLCSLLPMGTANSLASASAEPRRRGLLLQETLSTI